MRFWAKNYFDNSRIIVSSENNILKFTPDLSYSSGNFEILREKHEALQIDSKNGTNERLNLILERTNWPPDFFKEKIILECGCGAGPDTEILLKLGAKVISIDLAGLEKAVKNNLNNENVQFVQADITSLPLVKESFDIVFCHRVLQHTPDPKKTLEHILQFVKPDGAVFVHCYGKSWQAMLNWKYFLRPFTKNLPANFLYRLIQLYSWPAYILTTGLEYFFGKYARRVCYALVPFYNVRNIEHFKNKGHKYCVEYGVHDTFDALSPPYDHPLSVSEIKSIAFKFIKRSFEVVESRHRTYSLLRTQIK